MDSSAGSGIVVDHAPKRPCEGHPLGLPSQRMQRNGGPTWPWLARTGVAAWLGAFSPRQCRSSSASQVTLFSRNRAQVCSGLCDCFDCNEDLYWYGRLGLFDSCCDVGCPAPMATWHSDAEVALVLYRRDEISTTLSYEEQEKGQQSDQPVPMEPDFNQGTWQTVCS